MKTTKNSMPSSPCTKIDGCCVVCTNMTDSYKRLMSNISCPEIDSKLSEQIVARINQSKSKTKRNQVIVFGSISALSFVVLFPVVRYAVLEITQSEFYQYLSLAVSDSDIFLNNGRELILTLLESLPVLSLSILSAVTFIFLYSARAALISKENLIPIHA